MRSSHRVLKPAAIIVQAIKIPVIAASGIADARGVKAALAISAAGVQADTAYLLCPKAKTSVVHRAALKLKTARHTAITNLLSGHPARGIVNRLMRELGPINLAAPAFPSRFSLSAAPRPSRTPR